VYNDYWSTFNINVVVHLMYLYGNGQTIERDFTSNTIMWYNSECWHSDYWSGYDNPYDYDDEHFWDCWGCQD